MSQEGTEAGKTRTSQRGIWLFVIIAVVSLVGLADALYLTIEHVTGQSVRCTIISGCSEVLSSRYAVIAGVPTAMLGAAAYFSVFSLATLSAFRYRFATTLLALLIGVMALMSLWFLYLQAFVIHAFCQFCLLSAAVTFTLAVLIAIVLRSTKN